MKVKGLILQGIFQLTYYTQRFISRGLFDTLYDPYFHFCCKLAPESWTRGSSINPLRVYDFTNTHSLASSQCSLTSECSSRLKTAYSAQNGAPTREEEWFLCQFVRNGQTSAEQGLSTASQNSHHVHSMSWLCLPTSPYPTFFTSENLQSGLHKLINMWPKLHNKYTQHQWLKRLSTKYTSKLFH